MKGNEVPEKGDFIAKKVFVGCFFRTFRSGSCCGDCSVGGSPLLG